MVKNIDLTIFAFVRSLLYSLVLLFNRLSVHLFLCSLVCGRVVVWSCGRLFVWSFTSLFVRSCVRVVDSSFGLLVVCSCGRVIAWLFYIFGLLLFLRVFVDLISLFPVFFRGSFSRSCLLLRNIPRFKAHLDSVPPYREGWHKR